MTPSSSFQDFGRFTVGPFITAGYALHGNTLLFSVGARRMAIPLAHVRAFAVKERPRSMWVIQSQLFLRVDDGRTTRTLKPSFDPQAPGCRAVLELLRTRCPGADATMAPWAEAAVRLAVKAYPSAEAFLQPRTLMGAMLLFAAVEVATADLGPQSEAYMARAFLSLTVFLIALLLIRSGTNRQRAFGEARDRAAAESRAAAQRS
jgi:hypothetical protein